MALPKPRPSAEDRIRAALWFAERGFGVFSVWSTDTDGTCRCKARAACEQPGKHPVPANGLKAATTDAHRITAMLNTLVEPNWGMVPPEGVFILDVDGEGVARLAELEATHGPLPPTLRTNTANGQHVFLRWPAHLPRPIGQMFGYVTRWGSGSAVGYVIGPRSVHATGVEYTPVEPLCEIAEAPEAWATAAVAPAAPATEAGIEIHGGYELPGPGYSGSRYGEILRYVASRYMRGMSKAEVLSGVLTVLAPLFAEPLTELELRSRFERAWKGTPEKLGPPMAPGAGRSPVAPQRAVRPGMDAAALLELDLPPLRWLVPGLIPEGTTILAAEPKVGKSCLVYQVAVEAAIGGDLLGRRVTPGSVLYLALEDGQRRGRDRLLAALGGRTMPQGRLEVRWDARHIGAGLEDDISEWLDAHGDAVMVAVDTLGKVRPRSTGKQGAYETDVHDLARLQDLFRDRPVCLVIVHHARKQAADDFLASVSGTYGITGSADTILALRRKRMEKFGTIHATGRDIADAQEAVEFDNMVWRAAPGALPAARFERVEVYEVVKQHGPIFPKAIADKIGKERSAVQHLIDGLLGSGAVTRTGKGYVVTEVVIAPDALNVPTTYSHSERESSDGGHYRARESRPPGKYTGPCADKRGHGGLKLTSDGTWWCPVCHPQFFETSDAAGE